MNSANKHKIISLFSGCGGTDLGFLGDFTILNKHYTALPFEVVWANDIEPQACITYEKNLGDHITCGDIWDLDLSTLPEGDIVIGGFPCQDFSVAGLRKGFDSKRGRLYTAMKDVIEKVKPKIFLAENVKGLLSIADGTAIDKIKKDFASVGYTVEHHLVHTANYGISQTRERVFIVGIRNDLNLNFKFPDTTHTNNPNMLEEKKPWIPVKDVIYDLEDREEGFIPNHFWSKAKRYPGTQGNVNIDANKPGPTMRAEHHGNIEFHYKNDRRLSAREAARIQTFPDDFIFYNSTSSAYKQIGNAVPPVMAWHIAKAISEALSNPQ